jgi:hypothetical protein
MIPAEEWTMNYEELDMTMAGPNDVLQIRVLLAATKSGSLLPFQLIYGENLAKSRCESVIFPNEWDVTESNLSNEEILSKFIRKVIVPYVQRVRNALPEPGPSQQACCLMSDTYRIENVKQSYRIENVEQMLKENNITPLFVTNDRLQPLDLSV